MDCGAAGSIKVVREGDLAILYTGPEDVAPVYVKAGLWLLAGGRHTLPDLARRSCAYG